jgi:predicted esterase
MEEHHLSVGRVARYYTLGVAGPATRHVWVACHGYGQLAARFLRHFEPLVAPARLIVAPEGLSRFYLSDSPGERRVGASWMTREDRLLEIDDYVRYLDALYGDVLRQVERPAVRVTALGFSQGAATVSRWASFGRTPVDHVVLWGGELPPDLDLAAARVRLRAAHVTFVYGERDPLITPKVAAAAAARLSEQQIPHTVRTFAGGHEFNAAVLQELATA